MKPTQKIVVLFVGNCYLENQKIAEIISRQLEIEAAKIPACPDCGRPMVRREPWVCANCGEEMDV